MTETQVFKRSLEKSYHGLLEQYKEKANEFISAYNKQNVRLDLMDEMAELNLEISKNRHAMWTIEGLENK